jgi:hypothetical protein
LCPFIELLCKTQCAWEAEAAEEHSFISFRVHLAAFLGGHFISSPLARPFFLALVRRKQLASIRIKYRACSLLLPLSQNNGFLKCGARKVKMMKWLTNLCSVYKIVSYFNRSKQCLRHF